VDGEMTEAIKRGGVDRVLPLQGISSQVLKLCV
jgi:hypothetical protein